MIHVKISEIYLFLAVFIISILLFFTFFVLASDSSHTEQTYEMTDHQLKTNQTEKVQKHEHIDTNQPAIATTLGR
ncbi:hypothetical protein RN70_07395 [Staphylococcus schleiferi]|uniref:Putative secreted protein n=1 Tax=Staphylococcus schleiferi TaxID=1295 RepID=A0A7Z7QQC2_STASC|nr:MULTISPECIES: DNA damage-induced cell division inhibitor SosA [Staphylococcus]QGS45272.1 hypothetical protein FOB90_00510 [Mammaliicoccus fleurettii]AKS69345.1 hypothetical protein NP71_07200 [Staphylococcus schleiferi]AKS71515.1 hypothetical protein OA96_06790 [Staphylococcus schleiferi]AKS73735.1 hypothetical protein RN70_07395 [Staphylococcus schleiferi]EPD51936.1 hypothetical protein HMPREF1208_00742 [Staphylococcus sp. HGB0015]